MLGWAAANNVPFHEALQNSSKFGNKFDQAIAALKNGSTLSEALKHAKQSLPKHYLKAVEIAEQNNRLPEVLPSMGRNAAIMSISFGHLWITLFMPLIECFSVTAMIMVILPNLYKIFNELSSEDYALSMTPYSLMFMDFAKQVEEYAPVVMLFTLFIFALLLILIITRYAINLPVLPGFHFNFLRQPLFMWFPWLNRISKDTCQLEMALCMSVMLGAGDDIIQAAENSIQTCHLKWQRKKLQQFIDDVKSGITWMDAWERMNLSGPLELFIIKNYGRREKVEEGFKLIAQRLSVVVGRRFQRLGLLIKIGVILFTSLLIGAVVLMSGNILFGFTLYAAEQWK